MRPSIPLLLIFLSCFTKVFSLPYHDTHATNRALPASRSWYQHPDHPVHALFKRADGDGNNYAPVGSATWSSAFPTSSPDVTQLPQAWVDALNAAVAAGKIPNIPQSSNVPNTNPVYPNGLNPNSAQICSGTYKCRIPGDIWDAPNGSLAIAFDDGPTPASPGLYDFLMTNNQPSTHFMIGVNILYYPAIFQQAFNVLQADIACHTYTHPYMTTLNNMQILAQFGWSLELIHNSTGGRLPRYWRPPYGDTDVRVKAIAQEVFDLTTILWNQDTEDWSLGEPGGTTPSAINTSMTQWLTGPKSPGLVILEHELTNASVQAFMSAYPLMKSQGWNLQSAVQIQGLGAYLNSQNSTAPVTADGVAAGTTTSTAGPTTASGPSSNSSTPTASSTAPNGASSSKKSAGMGMRWARGGNAKFAISGLLWVLGILA